MSIKEPNQSNGKGEMKAESGEIKEDCESTEYYCAFETFFSMHGSDITACTQFASAELCITKCRKDTHQFSPLISVSFQHQLYSELSPSATAALSDCHGTFLFLSLSMVPLFYAIFIFSLFHCDMQ